MTASAFRVGEAHRPRPFSREIPRIVTGVWPLMSARQAEFPHHEVPGTIVPDEVRAEMASVDEAGARAQGVRLAEKIIAAALKYFPGVYLITPFLHYETTSELARFARRL